MKFRTVGPIEHKGHTLRATYSVAAPVCREMTGPLHEDEYDYWVFTLEIDGLTDSHTFRATLNETEKEIEATLISWANRQLGINA